MSQRNYRMSYICSPEAQLKPVPIPKWQGLLPRPKGRNAMGQKDINSLWSKLMRHDDCNEIEGTNRDICHFSQKCMGRQTCVCPCVHTVYKCLCTCTHICRYVCVCHRSNICICCMLYRILVYETEPLTSPRSSLVSSCTVLRFQAGTIIPGSLWDAGNWTPNLMLQQQALFQLITNILKPRTHFYFFLVGLTY